MAEKAAEIRRGPAPTPARRAGRPAALARPRGHRRRYARTNAAGMSRQPKKPLKPSAIASGKPAFDHGRDCRRRGRRRRSGHREDAYLAALPERRQAEQAGRYHVDAALDHVLQRRREIAIGDLHHVDAGALDEADEAELRHARRRRPGELSRLRLRTFGQSGERMDVERSRHRKCEEGIRGRDDRHEIALGVIGQLGVQHSVHGDRRAERKQQRVVVACADKGVDRDQRIGAGTVLHHHRLAPALRKPIGIEARGHVGRGAGRVRHDHLDRALRPAIGPATMLSRR